MKDILKINNGGELWSPPVIKTVTGGKLIDKEKEKTRIHTSIYSTYNVYLS